MREMVHLTFARNRRMQGKSHHHTTTTTTITTNVQPVNNYKVDQLINNDPVYVCAFPSFITNEKH